MTTDYASGSITTPASSSTSADTTGDFLVAGKLGAKVSL